MKIFYATSNKGKFAEVKSFLEQNNPEIILEQADIDLVEMQTNDQKAIALYKAKQAWEKLQAPVLVDDSAIYFEKYNNFPGILTKFLFTGVGFEGILTLTGDNSPAYFQCNLVFAHGPTNFEVFEGVCKGKIIKPKVLEYLPGLPYEAIFIPEKTNKTYFQLRKKNIHGFSYRIRALKKFLEWFQK